MTFSSDPKRTLLVHDYLLVMRGAERTFRAMADCWPEATLATLLYDEQGTEAAFADRRVRTSVLQGLRVGQAGFRRLLPLFPLAAGRLPVTDAELVVSSSSAFAHGVRRGPGANHVCYCHSPFRYAWHERERALTEVPRPLRPLLGVTLQAVRRWDVGASTRVDHYIANSRLTQERIASSYGRDSTIVHPPVDVDRFNPGVSEDFFLVIGELVAHKRVDLALEAARLAGRRVTVVGTGPDRPRLERRHGGHATFLGRVSDQDLAGLYPRARAVVMPNVEEFGITAVEAQAAGRPVLAADAGGAQETVLDGRTGVLVAPGSVDEMAQAMRDVDFDAFRVGDMTVQAARFSRALFKRRLKTEVERLCSDGGGSPS